MRPSGHRTGLLLALVPLALSVAARIALAGNIEPGHQYAWGENIGWINFNPSQGPGVTVTNAGLEGLAWGENVGWINLSPDQGGVANDGFGHLSGFAWGENVGWINFAPAGSGVHIDQFGRFGGFAWGENVGWINFGVPFGVATTYRWIPAPLLNRGGILLSIVILGLTAAYYLGVRRESPGT